MKEVFSPKEVAEAIGVSESSLRRWADEGRLKISRTAGGHRRILRSEAIRFVRASRSPIVRPEVLGLAELTEADAAESQGADPSRQFYDAAAAGNLPLARGLVGRWFLDGWSIAQICDGALRHAMDRLGDLWQRDPQGIMIEHRATDVCIAALNHLRSLISPPAPDAPRIVGGGAPGDPYTLASLMAATCLSEQGYMAINLGPDTPLEALEWAAADELTAMVWLSVSAPVSADQIQQWIDWLSDMAARRNLAVVVGGRQIDQRKLILRPSVQFGSSMGELVAYARGMLGNALQRPG